MFKLVRLFARSGRSLAESLFESEAARRVLPSLALHVDVGPDDRFGAGLGYMLGLTASTGGYAVPHGGAQSITKALVALLARHGGRLRLGARARRIVVRSGRAVAVVLGDGEEIPVRRAVLADTAAPALFLELLDPSCVPRHILERMRRYPMGWGTFKLDWALSAPVPWAVEQARESAVVHAGESVDDLARFTREVRAVKCQSGRTSWSGSRVSSTGAARRPIAIRSTATRTCPHSPRAVGTPSANASRIWSKRGSNSSRRAFVRRSWPGRFRRPPTWKGRTQTSLAATLAEALTPGTASYCFARYSHTSVTEPRLRAYTCARVTRIQERGCTGCVDTTPQ